MQEAGSKDEVKLSEQTANKRSPSDDVVRGTATEPEVADLRPALVVAKPDDVMRSAK